MSNYETIKNIGVDLYQRNKMASIHLAKKDYKKYLDTALSLDLEAIELITEYPHDLAAYTVAFSIIGSNVRNLTDISEQLKDRYCIHGLIALTEEATLLENAVTFLGKNISNVNCANLLVVETCQIFVITLTIKQLLDQSLSKAQSYMDNCFNDALMACSSVYRTAISHHPSLDVCKNMRDVFRNFTDNPDEFLIPDTSLRPLNPDELKHTYNEIYELADKCINELFDEQIKSDQSAKTQTQSNNIVKNTTQTSNASDLIQEGDLVHTLLQMNPWDIIGRGLDDVMDESMSKQLAAPRPPRPVPSNTPTNAPTKTASSSVSVPTQTKVEPPRNNAPSSTSSYSYKETWWSRLKDILEDFNDKIEDLGKWFYYNVYEAGEIGSNILLGGIIIFAIIGVISVWVNEGFGIAILAAFIGYIVCAIFMGIGKFILELCVEGIMYIFRYLFYNAWTLLATVVFIALIITFTTLSDVNTSRYNKSTQTNEVVVPITYTYYCTASSVLNVRSAPKSDAKVIGTLKKGQYIEVYNIVEGYAKFDFGNGYGYASTKYLKKTD